MREFRVLAKTLNFNTAADQLHISQPTLTRHIASLEQELGFRLLNRNPMALTAQGRYFLLGCDEVLSRYDEVVRQCKVIARKSSKRFASNMPLSSNSIWGDIFYRAVPEFARSFPDTPVPYFVHDDFSSIGQSIASGSADVGIAYSDLRRRSTRLHVRENRRIAFGRIFQQKQPLEGKRTLRFEDLDGQYLLCSSNAKLQTVFDWAIDALIRNGVRPKCRYRDFTDFDMVGFILEDDEIVVWQCGKHARSQCERETRRPPHRQWLCTLSDLCHVSQASRTRKSRRFRGDMQTPSQPQFQAEN